MGENDGAVKTRVPPEEWLGLASLPVLAAFWFVWGSVDARLAAHGWLSFGAGGGFGLALTLLYTVVLAAKGRLFLRDVHSIRRNRQAMARGAVVVPIVMSLLMLAASLSGGVLWIGFLGFAAGITMGLWPGILANFLRLRREVWRRPA